MGHIYTASIMHTIDALARKPDHLPVRLDVRLGVAASPFPATQRRPCMDVSLLQHPPAVAAFVSMLQQVPAIPW